MYKFGRPPRKRSERKQRRLALLRRKRPTIQERRRTREVDKRLFKQERAFDRAFDLQFPGLADGFVRAFRLTDLGSFPFYPPTPDPQSMKMRNPEVDQ